METPKTLLEAITFFSDYEMELSVAQRATLTTFST
jgi:hypothetical protein